MAKFSLTTLVLLPTMMICALPAHAEYSYQFIIPPGAEFAQPFGINNAGKVTGVASDGVIGFSFVYEIKSGDYTIISNDFNALEISNSGVMVGDIDGVCAIRDKKGNITTFFPPSYTDDSYCQARGVNSSGKVSGYEIDENGIWRGFIYDSNHGTYNEFLPSDQTIAQGINAQGQNVGSVHLEAGEAFPGSPEGRYGYLRQTDGSVKFFSITQSSPGQSRARGLSESGLISGFFLDADTGEFKGYVTTLSSGTEFENITLTDDELVYQKPCDPNLPPPPGPGYELFTDMFAANVRNDGVVSGSCTDLYFNETTGDFIAYNFGFIATPIK